MNRDFLLCTASVLLAFGSSSGQETKHPDANVKAIKALSERLEQQTNRFENMRTRIQYEGTSIERIIQFAPVGKTVTKITSNAQTAKFKQGVGGYVFERTPIGPLQPSGLIGLPYASDFSSIYGVNSKYAFELTSKDPGKGYVLSRIVLLENDEVRAKENKRFSMLAVINPLKHYYHSEKRKIDALNDPKQSTIRSVTATDSICTLEYDMLMAPSLSFRTETVFDIPANYACKMKRVVRVPSTPNDPDIVSRFEYSKVNNEYLLTKSITQGELLSRNFSRKYDHPVIVETEHEFKCNLADDVPEADFTLSAYGFPEPVGVKWERPIPRYIWWLIGVCGCTLSAFVLRLIAKQTNRRSAITAS